MAALVCTLHMINLCARCGHAHASPLHAGRLPILKTRFKGTWLAASSTASLSLSIDVGERVSLRIQLLRAQQHGTSTGGQQHTQRHDSRHLPILDIDLLDGSHCVRLVGCPSDAAPPAAAASSIQQPSSLAAAVAPAGAADAHAPCPCVLLVAPCMKPPAALTDTGMAAPGKQLALERVPAGTALVLKQPVCGAGLYLLCRVGCSHLVLAGHLGAEHVRPSSFIL